MIQELRAREERERAGGLIPQAMYVVHREGDGVSRHLDGDPCERCDDAAERDFAQSVEATRSSAAHTFGDSDICQRCGVHVWQAAALGDIARCRS